MVLNHLNLVVPNVTETAEFFAKHFCFELEPSRSDLLKILRSQDGFVLIISNLPGTTSYDYPKDFHIGFYQPDRAAVDELFSKIKADVPGMELEPRRIRDRYGFYFYAPGNILTEITCELDDGKSV